jgi:hypothetical protein
MGIKAQASSRANRTPGDEGMRPIPSGGDWRQQFCYLLSPSEFDNLVKLLMSEAAQHQVT